MTVEPLDLLATQRSAIRTCVAAVGLDLEVDQPVPRNLVEQLLRARIAELL